MKTRGILSWRRGIFSRCISLGFVHGPTGRSQGGAEAADTEAAEQSLTLDMAVTSHRASPSPDSLGPNLEV